ncbi:hypothetical protein PMI02_00989 [Novosphingobium sp. AP12]|nr:hypothetical protein PMI02_00989 [Novosphingobium sp. AP12]
MPLWPKSVQGNKVLRLRWPFIPVNDPRAGIGPYEPLVRRVPCLLCRPVTLASVQNATLREARSESSEPVLLRSVRAAIFQVKS